MNFALKNFKDSKDAEGIVPLANYYMENHKNRLFITCQMGEREYNVSYAEDKNVILIERIK